MNQNTSTPRPMPIMAHLVIGYPTRSESVRTAERYIEAGIEILELQIPFSHPTADGPVITEACQEATRQGVSVQDCIEVIRDLHTRFPAQEIIVMSYLNRIYHYGFQAFVTEMDVLGVSNLIVPDLPADLAASFLGKTSSLVKMVPVLAANTSPDRLDDLLRSDFDFYYLMSDFKITGGEFSLHPRLQTIIQKIKTPGNGQQKTPRIGIGFGISTPEQARLVASEVDVAIIGSALIQAQKKGKLAEYLESLQQIFHEKTNQPQPIHKHTPAQEL